MEHNDFLKSYSKKNEEVKDEVATPTSSASSQEKAPEIPDVNMNMSFAEKDTFRRTERRYGGGSYTPPPRNNSHRSRTIRNMIIASACTLVVAVIAIAILASNASKVAVPSFTNWSRNDFMLWASENNIKPQVEEQYNEQVEADKVISQSLAEGQKLKKGDFIKVVISLGPDLSVELPLPDLMNMTKDEIDTWASQNLMTKVRITSEYSETVPMGKTIKYEINDNTVVGNVKRDTPIYITVSKGPPSKTAQEITLPDFKTMGVSETVVFAQDKGLELTIEERYDDYIPKGSIISQSQPKDAKVYPGDELKVVVSLGQKKIMPSLKGMTKEEVMSKAGSLGLSVNIKERYSSSSLGRMIYQSIDEGTVLTDDMSLDVSFSLGPKIAVGNYVGQQKHSLEQWLETENHKGARLSISTTYTQNAAAAGTILQQSPTDTFLTRDKTISIVVSSGNNVFVPDFVANDGADYDTAITRESAIAMNNDKLVLVFETATNAAKLPGEVWYQSVDPGAELKEGSTVVLKYNPVGAAIMVPDFTGMTEAEIRAAGHHAKFTITYTSDSGTASAQSVASGTMVASGTAIEITLS